MNWLDIVFIFILVTSLWTGLKRGLVLQLIDLFGFVVSWYLAIRWGADAGKQLDYYFNISYYIELLMSGFVDFIALEEYVVTILGVLFILIITRLIFVIAGRTLGFFTSLPLIKSFNSISGGAIGLLKGAILIVAILIILNFMPQSFMEQAREGSAFYAALFRHVSVIIDYFVELLLGRVTENILVEAYPIRNMVLSLNNLVER